MKFTVTAIAAIAVVIAFELGLAVEVEVRDVVDGQATVDDGVSTDDNRISEKTVIIRRVVGKSDKDEFSSSSSTFWQS